MTLRYALVGCGKSKKDGYYPARELYDSNYFRLKRDYAGLYCENYSIFSAGHGVVPPSEVIETYDFSIRDLEAGALDAYRDEVAGHLYSNDWNEYDEILVLAGRAYIEPIQHLLDEVDETYPNVELRYPFEDTAGIGEQMGWLREKINAYDGFCIEPEDAQATLSAFF